MQVTPKPRLRTTLSGLALVSQTACKSAEVHEINWLVACIVTVIVVFIVATVAILWIARRRRRRVQAQDLQQCISAEAAHPSA